MLVSGGGSATSIYIINGTFLFLTWTLVIARCYVRHFLLRAFSREDWLAVIALIGYTVMDIFNIMIGTSGSGHHMVDLSPQVQANGMMWWWLLEEVYIVTTLLVKTSVVVVCLRLVDRRGHVIALYSITAIMIIYSIIFFCLNTFQCHPSDLFWKNRLGIDTTNKCMNPNLVGNLQLAYSVLNAMADITLSIATCALVYKLHLPTGGYRASVVVVLSFGVLACCAVLVRLPFLIVLKLDISDFLYYTTQVANWSCVEVGLGITATAASSLRPLIRTIVSGSKFIGTSIDPTSTRWRNPRDHEGYIRSGAAPPMKQHSRGPSDNEYMENDRDIEKIEMFPMPAAKDRRFPGVEHARTGGSKAGLILDIDLKS